MLFLEKKCCNSTNIQVRVLTEGFSERERFIEKGSDGFEEKTKASVRFDPMLSYSVSITFTLNWKTC